VLQEVVTSSFLLANILSTITIEINKQFKESTLLSFKRTHGNNSYPSSGIDSMAGLLFFSGGSGRRSSMDTLREEEIWPL